LEKTLVLIKPDGVQRGLVGEILGRFERLGLKIEELRLMQPSRQLAANHYPSDDEWLASVGEKTLADFESRGLDASELLGTSDALAIGSEIKSRLTEYLTSGHVVAIVLSGNRAIEVVRKVVGATIPTQAAPGTIRGDFGNDSPDVAQAEGRPVRNMIHASGNSTEAESEIELWFGR
jgi:nucleoside-diphosphate kinase